MGQANLRYNIEVKINDERIEIAEGFGANLSGRDMHRSIMVLKEAAVSQALIRAGWTPPQRTEHWDDAYHGTPPTEVIDAVFVQLKPEQAVAEVVGREPYLDGTPSPMHSLKWNHDACPACEDNLPIGTKLYAEQRKKVEPVVPTGEQSGKPKFVGYMLQEEESGDVFIDEDCIWFERESAEEAALNHNDYGTTWNPCAVYVGPMPKE